MVRLLVVDDDPTILMFVRSFFASEAADVEVVEVASGEEAIDVLGRPHGRFDCVLSDYRMGLVTGTDVLAFALKHRPGTARVLMTGCADPSLVSRAKELAQIHAFIEKPMSLEAFEGQLRESVLGRFLRQAEHVTSSR